LWGRSLDLGASAAQARDGSLDSLSVKELKSFLYYRDAALSGPKKTLVGRIEEVTRDHREIKRDQARSPEIKRDHPRPASRR